MSFFTALFGISVDSDTFCVNCKKTCHVGCSELSDNKKNCCKFWFSDYCSECKCSYKAHR